MRVLRERFFSKHLCAAESVKSTCLGFAFEQETHSLSSILKQTHLSREQLYQTPSISVNMILSL